LSYLCDIVISLWYLCDIVISLWYLCDIVISLGYLDISGISLWYLCDISVISLGYCYIFVISLGYCNSSIIILSCYPSWFEITMSQRLGHDFKGVKGHDAIASCITAKNGDGIKNAKIYRQWLKLTKPVCYDRFYVCILINWLGNVAETIWLAKSSDLTIIIASTTCPH